MKLSDKAIQEFKAIFLREFKRDLSDEEARKRAESFMRLILLLLRPSPPKSDPKTADDIGKIDESGESGTIGFNLTR